jgi:hypothetical protein
MMRNAPGQFLREAGNNLRVVLPWGNGWMGARVHLLKAAYEDNDLFVRLLSFALSRWYLGYDPNYLAGPIEDLNRALLESGSILAVAGDFGAFRLERRVSPETQSAMQQAQQPSGNASEHLRDAWAAAYGRDPNPGEAYRHAVKSVEALAIQLAEPNNTNATLSTAIGALRSHPGQFTSVLANQARKIGNPPTELTGFDTTLALMSLLLRNQTDRHSPGDMHEVVPITQEQAEWAVQTAVYLVEVLRRRWLHHV